MADLPGETVMAEKLHAMVLFGRRNSRMKDYFDVRELLREDEMDTVLLAQAIAATFARRHTALPQGVPDGLSDDFARDEANRAQWQAFLSKNRVDGPPLEQVIADIRERLTAPSAVARRVKVND